MELELNPKGSIYLNSTPSENLRDKSVTQDYLEDNQIQSLEALENQGDLKWAENSVFANSIAMSARDGETDNLDLERNENNEQCSLPQDAPGINEGIIISHQRESQPDTTTHLIETKVDAKSDAGNTGNISDLEPGLSAMDARVLPLPQIDKDENIGTENQDGDRPNLNYLAGQPVSIFSESVRSVVMRVMYTSTVGQISLIIMITVLSNVLYGYAWNPNPNTDVSITSF